MLKNLLPLLLLLHKSFSEEEYSGIELWCRDLPEELVTCSEGEIRRSTQAYPVCSDTMVSHCCNSSRVIMSKCYPKAGVVCIPNGATKAEVFGGNSIAFERPKSCRYVTGYDYRTTLILSVFLGMFGIDRFYLGYYGIGLFKFCTFGFFLLGQLVDIILIATQTVKPADGSDYLIGLYGPILTEVQIQNHTYFQYDDYFYKKYADEF